MREMQRQNEWQRTLLGVMASRGKEIIKLFIVWWRSWCGCGSAILRFKWLRQLYFTYAKMSRHRLIKKMNIAGMQSAYNPGCSITLLQIYILDELDDDALSDGGDEDLTPEQEGASQCLIVRELQWWHLYIAQLTDGVERIRAIVGSREESELDDTEIKNALWNEYFNVEVALQGLLGSSHPVFISLSYSFRRETRTKTNGRRT